MPPTTRRNASRAAIQSSSSPLSSKSNDEDSPALGSAQKRKASSSMSTNSIKKQKNQDDQNLQQTPEETVKNGESNAAEMQKEVEDEELTDENIQDAEANALASQSSGHKIGQDFEAGKAVKKNKTEMKRGDDKEEPRTAADNDEKPVGERADRVNGAVEGSDQRMEHMPSNILEKGIFYFFSRARVGLSQPASVQEIARSYLVLRPLPASTKLGVGPIDDFKNSRLLALPKKVLPKSGQDRFMIFVENPSTSVEQLKNDFITGSTYDTQNAGVRSSPPVTPLAEGVYAITSTGRESHLAYMVTIPSELGEVQKSVGLADKGSFILSTKNPETKGPAFAQFDHPAKFSKAIIEQFAGRRWMPTEPKHLDYSAVQLLLIGATQGSLGKAAQDNEDDVKEDEKNTTEEELSLLQDEDLNRVHALNGDDTIFDDLRLRKKDYPRIQTTW